MQRVQGLSPGHAPEDIMAGGGQRSIIDEQGELQLAATRLKEERLACWFMNQLKGFISITVCACVCMSVCVFVSLCVCLVVCV